MTVQELIEFLCQFPTTNRVILTDGEEDYYILNVRETLVPVVPTPMRPNRKTVIEIEAR